MTVSIDCSCCGMQVLYTPLVEIADIPSTTLPCPKCDTDIFRQGNGRSMNRDIAHQHETVNEALSKLDRSLLETHNAGASFLNLVVGGGRIREEVLSQLQYYRQQGYVMDFDNQPSNYGRITIQVKDY